MTSVAGRPRTLQAVLFDMDGLLVDSEPAWTRAERSAFEWLGGTWGPEVKAACVGRRLDDMAAELIRLAPSDVPVAAVVERLDADVAHLFAEGLASKPGALALLDALAAARVRLALVSSTRRPLVKAALRAFGDQRFDVLVTGEDVERPKPDPEPYLLAARRLGVDPAGCVVLEDSPAGVSSGVAAGCRVVAVPSGVPIESGPGVTVVPSLAGIDLDWLTRAVTDGTSSTWPRA
jgi:HAD superfamily hydrolase (TIGR01509 family)